ncbi:MAG: DNA polymerase III subunit chi [Rubrivivax sp.]|nr:DNA polymerase III subunit chi [Rubrivivax sp.]
MARVEFRSGLDDRLGYALRWLRRQQASGVRVRVRGAPGELQALSQQLWVADREGFVAHAIAGRADTPGLARTALWLGDGAVAGAEPSVWLNLGSGEVPLTDLTDLPAPVARIIELVGRSDPEVESGRQRWSACKRQGLAPLHEVVDGSADPAD